MATLVAWWLAGGIAGVTPMGVLAAQSATRGLSSPELNLHLTVLPDGSVDVRETIVFDFSDRTFREVDREISLRKFDGVIDVHASMDGRELPEGRGEGEVRIRRGRTLKVTWKFPKTTDSRHTFTLEYRAMGALALFNKRANLEWFLLPSRHRYRIDKATVEWAVPVSAVRAEPPSIDGPGWEFEATDQGWRAVRSSIEVDETAVLHESFEMNSMAVAMPTWQVNLDRAEQMAPAFVIGAATLMVMTIGIVVMTLFRYRRPAVDQHTVMPAALGSLPPALGTALTSASLTIGGGQMQATLLDLVRRGVLDIRQGEPSGRGKRTYQIATGQAADLRDHEQVLADALWLHMKNGVIEMKQARTRLVRAMGEFRRAVIKELVQEGLVAPDRRAAVKAIVIAGVVVAVFGVAGLVLFRFVFGDLGDIPLILPGAVVASGLMFVVSGAAISVLSDRGVQVGAQWRMRRQWLKDALRAGTWQGSAGEDWWPVGAGFGLASRMLKVSSQASSGPPVPEWLSELEDPSAALATIVVVTAVQAGGVGGGGGAVGGGGSSGAH